MGEVRLNSDVIQAVRDAIDIVDIAGGLTRLQRKGKRYEGLCPFHKEKTPSFSVDPDQGLFYCFGCGTGGDAIKLFMEQTGDDFQEAIEALARRYGISLPESSGPSQRRESEDLTAALEAANALFQRQLGDSELARGYLDQRRIPAELQQKYGLGYARNDWRSLLTALRRTISLDTLIAAGLVGKSERTGEPYDRFRHRLMFPIHSPAGRLVGFGGRTLGDDRAKYVNTSETERFHKGRLLYGLHQSKRDLRDHRKALLVEGYFDVIGAAACGITGAVAGMGTALTPEQGQLMARYCDDVVVAYDGDEAGEKAFRKSLPILLGAGLGVRRAQFPSGHDPDSLRLEDGPEAVIAIVDQAAEGVEIEIERLVPPPKETDPRVRARAAAEIIELLRPIRDPLALSGYSRKAAERLGVPEDTFNRRMGRAEPSSPSSAGAQEEASAPSASRSMEEKALTLLLQPGQELPPPDRLPPLEVFFDSSWRNIYDVFCALYMGGDFSAPTHRDVVSNLDPEGEAVDRAARLLLEDLDSGESGGDELQETLDTLLQHYWRTHRQHTLMRDIRQAQQAEDHTRLAQLLEEKTTLSRSLHPNATGKPW